MSLYVTIIYFRKERFIKIFIDILIRIKNDTDDSEGMARKIEIKKEMLLFRDNDIDGFLERIVTPFGTSAKADVPKKYIGKRVYVIVTKKKIN